MKRRRIVLGVTVDVSLPLLKGYPEYLVQRGWEVHVVSSPGVNLDQLSSLPHVYGHALRMNRRPNPLQDIRSLIRWIRLLREIRPFAVSVGTPKAGLLGSISAWLTRVPIRIYLMRGLRLETSTGVSRWIFLLTERIATTLATHVLAISPSLRSRAVELRLVKPQKIRVLGHGSSNGTDTEEFDSTRFDSSELDQLRRRYGIVPNVPVVGFVGRLTRDKGLFVLADALDALSSQGIPVQLLIVGGIDDASGADALRRLEASAVPVSVVGHVDNTAIYYALMDVFCLPSYREGFGNVVIEASSSGIPVVTSDATGVVDAVSNGETGVIFAVGDSDGLASAIGDILNDPERANRLGGSGRKWVKSRFSRELVQNAHANDLEAIAAQWSRKHRPPTEA